MSLLQLNAELTRFQRSKVRPRAKRPHPAASPSAAGAAPAARAAWRRARAFDAMSYRVPGIVPPLRQPTSMTCWATVTTMMMSWKRSQSLAIETALGDIHQEWADMFRNNQGLSGADKPRFLAAAGLQAEPPMSFSLDGWLQMLRTYGPLWVTTDEDPSAAFAIHARIIVGMAGDGTPTGTSFQIVDPATGTEYSEDVQTFIRKFEEEARDASRPLRIQVVHWPPNAQGTTQSLSRMASRTFTRARSRALDATLAWGARVSAEFRNRVREICANLGCDPNHLMAAMAFETGETFSPSIRNRSSGATGLIQFMPTTARNLGTTTDDLAAMSAEQQLGYVERYFAPYRERLSTLEDVYMAILWPRAVGQPADTVLFSEPSRAYQLNRGLDTNRDGRITKAEASSRVRAKLEKGLQPALTA